MGVSWPYAWAKDGNRSAEQLQVIGYALRLHARKTRQYPGVRAKWDRAHTQWTDIRYGAGGGNLNKLRRRAKADGVPIELGALAAAYPDWMKPHLKPWKHSAAVWRMVERDRAARGILGEEPGGGGADPDIDHDKPSENGAASLKVIAVLGAIAVVAIAIMVAR